MSSSFSHPDPSTFSIHNQITSGTPEDSPQDSQSRQHSCPPPCVLRVWLAPSPARCPQPLPPASRSPQLWHAKPNPKAAGSQLPASAPARGPPVTSPASSSAPTQRLAPLGSWDRSLGRCWSLRLSPPYLLWAFALKDQTEDVHASQKNGAGCLNSWLSPPRRLNVTSVQINCSSESFPSSPPSFLLIRRMKRAQCLLQALSCDWMHSWDR